MIFHIKRNRLALPNPACVAGVLAAAFLCWPQTAAAEAGVCYVDDQPTSRAAESGSLRERASLLAPSLRLKAWYQPDRRKRDHTRIPIEALTSQRRTARQYGDVRAGWQVDANWDLVDLTDLAVPDLFGETARLQASGCDELGGDAHRLFDDVDGDEGGEP